LVDSTDADASWAYRPLVHDLFEVQVDRTPEAIAIHYEGIEVTYAELNGRANRLARRLRELGAGPDVLVGICAERTPDLLTAVLAVLKAGAAYLPLDPAHPGKRLRLMTDDAEASMLVADRSDLPWTVPSDLIVSLRDYVSSNDSGNLVRLASPDNLAYVIYTSGSTGAPKGIAMSHAPLVNLVSWHLSAMPRMRPRTLQFASLGFDVSFQETFVTWAAGGTVVMPSDETRADLTRVLEYARRARVDRLFLPYVALSFMGESHDVFWSWPDLREMTTAGEQLKITPALTALFEHWPDVTLRNQYGPSEAPFATEHLLTRGSRRWPMLPPVGCATANADVHVLDDWQRPVPAGVLGEVYIGGAPLARGYIGRPDLTARSFVPDSIGGRPGRRLYRTGDIGRWRDDGSLEFLGRRDGQVKIRGNRVELGEVEARLVSQPGVRAAAVVCVDRGDQRHLAAYVVMERGEDADWRSLRAGLASELPDYMVPTIWARVESLPVTINGKVDRQVLVAAAPSAASGPAAGLLEPRSAGERAIAEVWREVFGLERVGVDADFFELGGSSLTAMQIVSRVRARLRVDASLGTLIEAPTIAEFTAAVSAGRTWPGGPATPHDSSSPTPLSFAQRQMWLLDNLLQSPEAYNVPMVFSLDGPLDAGALDLALAEVVGRHEALRTAFRVVSDRVDSFVEPRSDHVLTVVDVRDHQGEVDDLVAREITRPFDLSRAPMLRGLLLRRRADSHVLALTVHHVATDEWSEALLLHELSRLYAAFAAGVEPPLPPVAHQYGEFAVWHGRWMRDGSAVDLDYWRSALAGSASCDLPLDRPRSTGRSLRGAVHSSEMPGPFAERLSRFCRQQRATPFMVLVAAFVALLHRHGGQDEVVVGTPMAVRPRQEFEATAGNFVNVLPLRTDLRGDPTFRELLDRVRETCLGADAHRQYPFDRLVGELRPQRSASRNPFFDAVFLVERDLDSTLELSGLDVERLHPHTGAVKFDLTMQVTKVANGLRADVEYAVDLFDPSTAAQLATRYWRLLDAALADPGQRLSVLPMLGSGERAALTRPPRALATSGARTLPEAFDVQASATPEAIAISEVADVLTYRELAERSIRLANHLVRHGAGPGGRVGVHMGRSADLVVAILAVLRTGAAYVPLDSGAPAARNALILDDARAELVVSESHLRSGLEGYSGPVLAVDLLRSEIQRERADARAPAGSGAAPAYVIYTSGSTGRPKGVLVSHRSVLRLFAATRPRYGFGPGDVWTLFHSCAFDFSVWEMWGALLHGGRLVVVADPVVRAPHDLHRLLRDEGVTILSQTPSAFRALDAADAWGPVDALPALRLVVFGGEALYPADFAGWLARHPAGRPVLVNMYGITETTVHATERTITGPDAGGSSVIGRPLADVAIYVLDRHLEPVPAGVAGEIVVAGACLGDGYAGAPGQTAERFVPHPFASAPGTRMYRSGDLARWLSSGELEYLGRLDHQVKIRGFRIELGEVEAALRRHEGVADAAAVVWSRTDRQPALAAYVVPARGGPIDLTEIREHARRHLPQYMTPTHLQVIDRLPLTVNGKVDRRALPEPSFDRGDLPEPYVEPVSATERCLVDLFEGVLRVGAPGVNDRFFDFGGDSLLAVTLVVRARAAGMVLHVEDVFVHQSPAALAALVDTRAGDPLPVTAGPVALGPVVEGPATDEGVRAPTLLQLGMLYHARLDAGRRSYHNVHRFVVRCPLRPPALRDAVDRLVARHPALRTSFRRNRGESEVVVHPATTAPVTSESAPPGEARAARLRDLVDAARAEPFDLTRAPLIRFTALDGDGEFDLIVAEHHTILDGWSVAVLASELARVYEGLLNGREPVLAAVPPADRVHAELERHALASAESRRFWMEELRDVAPTPLPALGSSGRPGTVWTEPVPIPAGLAAALQRVATRLGVPLKSVLLAVHARVMAMHTGAREVVVGLPLNGRPELPGSDAALGLFLNTVPVRLTPGAGSWADLVRSAALAEQRILAHRRFPLAEIQRMHGGRMLFDTLCNFVHFHAYRESTAIREVHPDVGPALTPTNYPLVANLLLDPDRGELIGLLDYDSGLLSNEQARTIAASYAAGLSAVSAGPGPDEISRSQPRLRSSSSARSNPHL
jgi:amino acid adenylation domain-containing protein